jgi:hypothetical protein
MQRIGQHEAGHHVVARRLGFMMGPLELRFQGSGHETEDVPHDGSATVILHRPVGTTDAISGYLRDRVQVLFAGVLAESLSNGQVQIEIARKAEIETAVSDFAKAAEHLELLVNLQCASNPALCEPAARDRAVKLLRCELYDTTKQLVIANADVIEKIGSHLSDKARSNFARWATVEASEFDDLFVSTPQIINASGNDFPEGAV